MSKKLDASKKLHDYLEAQQRRKDEAYQRRYGRAPGSEPAETVLPAIRQATGAEEAVVPDSLQLGAALQPRQIRPPPAPATSKSAPIMQLGLVSGSRALGSSAFAGPSPPAGRGASPQPAGISGSLAMQDRSSSSSGQAASLRPSQPTDTRAAAVQLPLIRTSQPQGLPRPSDGVRDIARVSSTGQSGMGVNAASHPSLARRSLDLSRAAASYLGQAGQGGVSSAPTFLGSSSAGSSPPPGPRTSDEPRTSATPPRPRPPAGPTAGAGSPGSGSPRTTHRLSGSQPLPPSLAPGPADVPTPTMLPTRAAQAPAVGGRMQAAAPGAMQARATRASGSGGMQPPGSAAMQAEAPIPGPNPPPAAAALYAANSPVMSPGGPLGAVPPPSGTSSLMGGPLGAAAPPAATSPLMSRGGPLGCVPARSSDVECAVTLEFLQYFVNNVVMDDALTTAQVISDVVKPATAGYGCRYVDLPNGSGIQPGHVGRPTYFISHTWGKSFRHLVRTLSLKFQDAIPSEIFCWVDAFAINQHAVADVKLLELLKDAVSAAAGGTVVILGEDAGPLRRVWCLYEFWNTVKLKGPDALHMLASEGMGAGELRQMAMSIDVENAGYTVRSDRDMILNDIQKDYGGSLEPFNNILKFILLLDPLDYSADLAALQRHTTSGMWDLSQLAAWQATAQEFSESQPADLDPARGFVLYGGPGEGKSTFSASVLAASAAHETIVDAAGGRNDEAPGSRQQEQDHEQAHSISIHAYHFCKHNDANRHNLLRVVKTLAYQLGTCPQLPQFGQAYTRLRLKALDKLDDARTAAELLLVKPLRRFRKRPPPQDDPEASKKAAEAEAEAEAMQQAALEAAAAKAKGPKGSKGKGVGERSAGGTGAAAKATAGTAAVAAPAPAPVPASVPAVAEAKAAAGEGADKEADTAAAASAVVEGGDDGAPGDDAEDSGPPQISRHVLGEYFEYNGLLKSELEVDEDYDWPAVRDSSELPYIKVTLLMDALDEGAPAIASLSGAAGKSVASGFSSVLDLLRLLLRDTFNLRVVLTSRPDPEAFAGLDRRLAPGRTCAYDVWELRREDAIQRQLIQQMSSAHIADVSGKVVKALIEGSASIAAALQDAALPAPAPGAGGRGDGEDEEEQSGQGARTRRPGRPLSLVYIRVIMELLERGVLDAEEVARDGTAALPADLDSAYALAFGTCGGASPEEEAGHGHGQQEARTWASEGGVQQDRQGRELSDSEQILQLLAVLSAAREPPSPATLALLALEQARPKLPLWGTLFYQRDLRVYGLHKSLYEWMAKGKVVQVLAALDSSPACELAAPSLTTSHSWEQLLGSAHHNLWSSLPPDHEYALRHGPAHMALAKDTNELEACLLDLRRWVDVFHKGLGRAVARDLEELVQVEQLTGEQSAIAEVCTFIKRMNTLLEERPANTLAAALSTPVGGLIFRIARQLLLSVADGEDAPEEWRIGGGRRRRPGALGPSAAAASSKQDPGAAQEYEDDELPLVLPAMIWPLPFPTWGPEPAKESIGLCGLQPVLAAWLSHEGSGLFLKACALLADARLAVVPWSLSSDPKLKLCALDMPRAFEVSVAHKRLYSTTAQGSGEVQGGVDTWVTYVSPPPPPPSPKAQHHATDSDEADEEEDFSAVYESAQLHTAIVCATGELKTVKWPSIGFRGRWFDAHSGFNIISLQCLPGAAAGPKTKAKRKGKGKGKAKADEDSVGCDTPATLAVGLKLGKIHVYTADQDTPQAVLRSHYWTAARAVFFYPWRICGEHMMGKGHDLFVASDDLAIHEFRAYDGSESQRTCCYTNLSTEKSKDTYGAATVAVAPFESAWPWWRDYEPDHKGVWTPHATALDYVGLAFAPVPARRDMETKGCPVCVVETQNRYQRQLEQGPRKEDRHSDRVTCLAFSLVAEGPPVFQGTSLRSSPPMALASGSLDTTVRVWDLHESSISGAFRCTLSGGHGGAVRAVAWLSRGPAGLLASGGDDGRIVVWDPRPKLATGGTYKQRQAERRQAPQMVLSSPDTQQSGAVLSLSLLPTFLLVSASSQWPVKLAAGYADGSLRLWQVPAPGPLAPGAAVPVIAKPALQVLEAHSGPIRALACAPDASLVASGSDDCTVKMWSVTSGKCMAALARGKDLPLTGTPVPAPLPEEDSGPEDWDEDSFSEKDPNREFEPWTDTRLLGKASEADGYESLSEGESAEEDEEDEDEDGRSGAAAGPGAGGSDAGSDGEEVVAGAESAEEQSYTGPYCWTERTAKTQVVQSEGTKALLTYKVKKRWVHAVIGPEGQTKKIKGYGRKGGGFHAPRVAPGFGHLGPVVSLAFSPVWVDGGCRLASGSIDGTAFVLHGRTGVVSRAAVKLKQAEMSHTRAVTALAIAPSLEHVAGGGFDGIINIFHIPTGMQVARLEAHCQAVFCMQWAPAAAIDTVASTCNAALPRHARPSQVHCYKLSSAFTSSRQPSSGILASGSEDGDINLWDARTGQALASLPVDLDAEGWQGSTTLCFSPDCITLAAVVARDLSALQTEVKSMWRGEHLAMEQQKCSVQLWDLPSLTLRASLHGHGRLVLSLAFSPDSSLVLTGGACGSVRVWRNGTQAQALMALVAAGQPGSGPPGSTAPVRSAAAGAAGAAAGRAKKAAMRQRRRQGNAATAGGGGKGQDPDQASRDADAAQDCAAVEAAVVLPTRLCCEYMLRVEGEIKERALAPGCRQVWQVGSAAGEACKE